MPAARVSTVRSVDVGVTDLETAVTFFTDVWHLDKVADVGGVIYLRATGPFHHVFSVRRAPRTGMIRIVLGAEGRETVERLYEHVSHYGQTTAGPPKALARPGGGYGFGFQDPEGRNFAVVCDVADHGAGEDRADRPRKISHVNLNCANNDATFKFMSQALGFRLSDHANNMRFVRCSSDHHSLVLGFNDAATLNHIAFELPDLDSVMRGIGRLRDHGYPIEWGPGRHGPGDNVFAYFCGPEELPVEYTAEMQQVDDGYRVGRPQDWKWPPGRVDQWGIMAGPTARVKRAQRLFRFSADGYRLD